MAISDKLNYLIETKSKFKDRLNSLGAEIIESTTFRNYLTWLDEFYGDVSNKTDLAKNGIVGRTSQESTTGKNLNYLQNLKWIVNSSGKVVTNNYYWDAIIDTTNNNSIYISGNYSLLSDGVLRIGLYSSYPQLGSQGTRVTYSGNSALDTTNCNYVLLCYGTSSEHTIEEVQNSFMVSYGTTMQPYEPYTGGQPSPNPDYPQEINNLSGDVEYRVRGKNLFDKDNANILKGWFRDATAEMVLNSGSTDRIITFKGKPNTTYTISKKLSNRFRVDLYNSLLSQDGTYTFNYPIIKNDSGTNITVTTTATDYYIYIHVYQSSDGDFQAILNSIQIEYGNSASSYQSYVSESFPLSLKSRNLFDSNGKIIENFMNNSGMTYTLNNGIYTLNGTNTQRYIYLRYNVELEPGSYIFTGCPKGGSFTGYSCIVRVGGESLFDYGDGVSFTLTEKETVMVYPVRVGADSITVNNLQFKPMLEKANNLFDKDNANILDGAFINATAKQIGSNANAKCLFIEVEPNTPYIISKSKGNRFAIGTSSVLPKNGVQLSNILDDRTKTSFEITSSSDTKYLTIYFTISPDDDSLEDILSSIEVYKNVGSSPYEPYYDINLCNISDYKDRIYSQNGEFYLEKKTGEVVLDGSENWEKHATTAADIYMIFIPNSIGYEYGSGKIAPAICNSFIARALGSFPDNTYGVFGITPSLQTRFFVGATGSHYADINAWKQYLANNNMIVYFALATPTTTKITQENYPTLYSQLLAIQEFLTKYKINKEFLLDYSSPEIEY